MRPCRTRRWSPDPWIRSRDGPTRRRSARRPLSRWVTWSRPPPPSRCCQTRQLAVGSAKRLRLGTRGSRLALIQSEVVAQRLRDAGHEVELVPRVTEGDVRPVDMSPGEGVFVAAIARALLAGEIDIAVHSAKDVPLEEDPGLAIAAYPERADPRDALITRQSGGSLESMARGAVVGTDSPRRAGFLLAARPDLKVIPLHGNVGTRFRRLDEGAAGGLVLAAAGIGQLCRRVRCRQ